MRIPWFLPLLLALSGCRAAGGEGFPSLLPRPAETPRSIEAGPAAAPGLPSEMAQAIASDLDRDDRALRSATDEIARAAASLAAAMVAARAAAPGSSAWVEAQIHLSRLDQARSGLGEVRARLATLGPLLDGLPGEDPLFVRWQQLSARADSLLAEADRRAQDASRRLGG